MSTDAIATLMLQLKTTRSSRDKWHAECGSLRLQLAGKDERIAELERDVGAWRSAAGHVDNFRAECQSLRAQLASKDAHLAAMQARIDGLEGRINGVSRGEST